jgi:hypothetical protein
LLGIVAACGMKWATSARGCWGVHRNSFIV